VLIYLQNINQLHEELFHKLNSRMLLRNSSAR